MHKVQKDLIDRIEGKYPYYFDSGQLIINADCLKIMELLEDNSIDLVLTDPPYGIGINGAVGGGSKRGKIKECKPSDWVNEIPSENIFASFISKSKNQIIWGGNYFINYLNSTRCMITWYKRDGLPERTFADSELAWTSFDKNSKVYNIRWDGFIRDSKEPREMHPTQKPLKLFKDCLLDFSKENDLILDCFNGSGTTSVACYKNNRFSIGIELDKDYYKLSCERLKNECDNLMLF